RGAIPPETASATRTADTDRARIIETTRRSRSGRATQNRRHPPRRQHASEWKIGARPRDATGGSRRKRCEWIWEVGRRGWAGGFPPIRGGGAPVGVGPAAG